MFLRKYIGLAEDTTEAEKQAEAEKKKEEERKRKKNLRIMTRGQMTPAEMEELDKASR